MSREYSELEIELAQENARYTSVLEQLRQELDEAEAPLEKKFHEAMRQADREHRDRVREICRAPDFSIF